MTMNVLGISVVIPAYGRLELLLRAIHSVAASDVRELEIVVIDDASPLPLEPHVPLANVYGVPIRYYRLSRNSGSQAARNLGIRRSRHKFVAFLDSDDVFLPEKIDRVRAHLMHTSYDILFHAVEGMAGYGRIGALWNRRLRGVLPLHWLLTLLNPVVTPSLVIKRGLGLGPSNMRHAEDWAFLMSIVQPGASVLYLEEPLSRVFRPVGSEGGVSAQRWRMRKGEFKARSLLLRRVSLTNYLRYTVGTAMGGIRVLNDLVRLRYWR